MDDHYPRPAFHEQPQPGTGETRRMNPRPTTAKTAIAAADGLKAAVP